MKRSFFLIIFIIFAFSNLFFLYAQKSELKKINIAVEGKGVAGVVIDQTTAAEIIKKFGENYQIIEHPTYSNQIKYKKLGLSFFYCLADEKKKIFSIELREPYSVKTSKGIILGKSKVKDVFRLYGTSQEISETWLTYQGVDFRNVNLKTNKINNLSREMIINEINLYSFNFELCQRVADESKTKQ